VALRAALESTATMTRWVRVWRRISAVIAERAEGDGCPMDRGDRVASAILGGVDFCRASDYDASV
jgi:hypothetical protein